MSKTDHIQVSVRIKPLMEDEIQKSCLQPDISLPNTIVLDAQGENRYFTYDHVAGAITTQNEIFNMVGKPQVLQALAGYNGCVFAYGQTGAGKTHTMLGSGDQPGILPRSLEYLFEQVHMDIQTSASTEYLIKCSFLEIYNEHIIDLLNPSTGNLQLREDLKKGVYVEYLTEESCSNITQAINVIQKGNQNRHIGSTNMNIESSRSHSVFTVQVESQRTTSATMVKNHKFARMHYVDLAGSERQKSSQAQGERLREGCNINKSLHILGNVINSLAEISSNPQQQRFVHYRDSKLTFLLKDSLGGNSMTHLIANVHQGSSQYYESLSTLQFAKRVKQVKNKAQVNEDDSGNLESLKNEIKRLKQELAKKTIQNDFTWESPQRNREHQSVFQSQNFLSSLEAEAFILGDQKYLKLEELLKCYLEQSTESETTLHLQLEKADDIINEVKKVIKEGRDREVHLRTIISLLNAKIQRKGLNDPSIASILQAVNTSPIVWRVIQENLELKEGQGGLQLNQSAQLLQGNLTVLLNIQETLKDSMNDRRTLQDQIQEKINQKFVSPAKYSELENQMEAQERIHNQRVEALVQQMKDLKVHNIQLELTIADNEFLNERLTTEHNLLKKELERIQNQAQEKVEGERTQLEQELKGQIEHLTNELQRVRGDWDKLFERTQVQARESGTKIEELNQTNESLKIQQQDKDSQINRLSAQLEQLYNEIQEQQKAWDHEQVLHDELVKEFEEKILRASDSVQQSQALVQIKEELIDELEQQIKVTKDAHQMEIDNYEQTSQFDKQQFQEQIAELNLKIKTLEETIKNDQAQQEVDQQMKTNQTIQTLEQDIERLKAIISTLEIEIQKQATTYQNQVEELKTVNFFQENEIQDMKSAISEYENELPRLTNIISNLEEDVKVLKRTNSDQQNQIETGDLKIDSLEEQINGLKIKLQQSQQMSEDYGGQLQIEKLRNQGLNTQFETEKQAKNAVQNELQEINRQLGLEKQRSRQIQLEYEQQQQIQAKLVKNWQEETQLLQKKVDELNYQILQADSKDIEVLKLKAYVDELLAANEILQNKINEKDEQNKNQKIKLQEQKALELDKLYKDLSNQHQIEIGTLREQLNQHLRASNQQNDQTSTHIDRLLNELKQAETNLILQKNQCNETELKFQGSLDQIKQLIRQIEIQEETLKSEIRNKELKFDELQKQFNVIQSELIGSNQQVKDLMALAEAGEHHLHETKSKFTQRLQAQKQQSEDQLKRVQQENEDDKRKLKQQYTNLIDNLSAQNNQLVQEVKEKEAVNSELINKLNTIQKDLQRKNELLQNEFSSVRNQNSILSSQNDDQKSQNLKLYEEKQQLQKQVYELNQILEQLRSELTDNEQTLKTVHDKAKDFCRQQEKEINEIKEQYLKLEEEHNAVIDQNQQLQQDNDQLITDLQVITQEKELIKEEAKQIRQIDIKLKKENTDLSEKFGKVQNDRNLLQRELENLQNEIDQLMGNNNPQQKVRYLNQIKSENSQLKQDKHNLTDQINQLIQEKHILQQKLKNISPKGKEDADYDRVLQENLKLQNDISKLNSILNIPLNKKHQAQSHEVDRIIQSVQLLIQDLVECKTLIQVKDRELEQKSSKYQQIEKDLLLLRQKFYGTQRENSTNSHYQSGDSILRDHKQQQGRSTAKPTYQFQ